MDLENKEWAEFSLTSVFDKIQRGKRLKKADHIEGNIPYASSTALNNGIDDYIGNTKNIRVFENCLTIANSGSVGSTFYQPFKVIASDHVTKLQNKNFNKYTYLFLATMISRLQEKYSFNREINDYRIRKEKILLPIDKNGNPDYVFMENYMRKKETELLGKYEKYISSKIKHLEKELDKEVEWKEFKIGNIFDVFTGSLLPKKALKNGNIPRITATDNDNGVIGFYEKTNHKNYRELSNFISVSFLGSVFYHPYTASLDMKIHAIKIPNLELNKYIGEFLVLCFKRTASYSSYGNQLSSTDLPKKKVLLPIDEKGNPDFEYMENYTKQIEQKKLKDYLEYKQLNIN